MNMNECYTIFISVFMLFDRKTDVILNEFIIRFEDL